MKLAGLWFALVALACAAACALLVTLPRLAQHELDREASASLMTSRRAAETFLKLHSLRWIEATAHAASDSQLGETIDQADRGGKLDLLHRTAQDRLREFNHEWKAWQAVLVDGHGKVLARTGADEDVWQDNLSDVRVIAEALRGYRLDDTWEANGKLYRVSASPVIRRDHYAGALAVVRELGPDLLGSLRDSVGAEAALLVDGTVTARSSEGRIFDRAAEALGKERPAAARTTPNPAQAEDRESRPVRVPGARPADPGQLAISLSLPGEAAARGARLLLVRARPSLGGVFGLLQRVGHMNAARMPLDQLGYVGGGLLGVLLIGLLLLFAQHSLPLRRLQRTATALSRGESQKLDDAGLPGPLGTSARLVNAALDKLQRQQAMVARQAEQAMAAPPRDEMAAQTGIDLPPDLPAYVGLPPAPEPPPPESSAAPASRSVAAAAAAAHDHAFAPAWGSDALASGDIGGQASSQGGADGNMLSSLDEVSGLRDVKPVRRPDPPPAESFDAPYPPAYEPPQYQAGYPQPSFDPQHYPPPQHANESPPYAPHYAQQPEPQYQPPHYAQQQEPQYAPPYAPQHATPGAMPVNMVGMTGTYSAWAEPPPAAPPDPLEEEFRVVFQDFVDMRQRCGESVEGVTYDKFTQKLRTNRDQLIAKFACQAVKFQVYVKDGKAALKATPIL